jgi:hypothetical protein
MAAYGSIVDSDKPRTTYFVSDASVIQQPAHLILRVAALHALQLCLILSLRGPAQPFLFAASRVFGRLAGARSETNLNRGPHDPRQDIEARQSLSARPVRAGRLGCTDQAEELGASWAQALDRGAKKRLHHNVLAIALANKLARIAWSVPAHGRNFEEDRYERDNAGVTRGSICSKSLQSKKYYTNERMRR